MTIFETIGITWVIFTSALATIGIMYLAFVGIKVIVNREMKDADMPVEVKEMFKIAR